jgi:hypothetical protein
MGNSHSNRFKSCNVCLSFGEMKFPSDNDITEIRKHTKDFIGKRFIYNGQCTDWSDKYNVSDCNFNFYKYQIRADLPVGCDYMESYIPTVILDNNHIIIDISYSNIRYLQYDDIKVSGNKIVNFDRIIN